MSEPSKQLARGWQDARGCVWFICDGCDAAVPALQSFSARQRRQSDRFPDDYCLNCAREMCIEWGIQWAKLEAAALPLGMPRAEVDK